MRSTPARPAQTAILNPGRIAAFDGRGLRHYDPNMQVGIPRTSCPDTECSGLFIRGRLTACFLLALLLLAQTACAATSPGTNQRKALIVGRGDPFRDPGNIQTHPQMAKNNFLQFVGNPGNDPAKGWTADLSWDLMVRLGMNPTNTPLETLFDYIGQHQLGYRIVIQNGAFGQSATFWGSAVDNGMMPFAPHGNNTPNLRVPDPSGLTAAVGVGGGVTGNLYTYGPSLEFFDAVRSPDPHSDLQHAAQSWANQVIAAKFARILDTHPGYNIWDARQHLRQAASFWSAGWTEKNGYGRVDANARVGKLLPAPPLEFSARLSHDRRKVVFQWRNFLQSDFAAAVIARKDGRVIYSGTGTDFTWTGDVDGAETFTYWSQNQAGEKSGMESYQTCSVAGLQCRLNRTCLVLGWPGSDAFAESAMLRRFQDTAPEWLCEWVRFPGKDSSHPPASASPDAATADTPDFAAMVNYAISNDYRLILTALPRGVEGELYRYKSDCDRAAASGHLIVAPHNPSPSQSRKPQARRLSPPRLFSVVTVGGGETNNLLSFGPGLEVFDAPRPTSAAQLTQTEAAGVVAGKLAAILDANPAYNIWDARQHLRQSASYCATGWIEDGGYGRPPDQPAKITLLDPAPPLDAQAVKSDDGKSVTFSWQNFLQSSFAETVIQRKDGRVIYHGTGTQFVWRSDVKGDEAFKFFSKDKSGCLSRTESYTVFLVTGLVKN